MLRLNRATLCLLIALATGPILYAAPAVVDVRLTDYLNNNWRNELIHESVALDQGVLRSPVATVMAPDGKPTTCQVTDVVRYEDGSIQSMKVWFIANLPAMKTATYKIHPGKSSKGAAGVGVDQAGDRITLWTNAKGRAAIVLPAGKKDFEWYEQMPDELAPIQSLVMPSGKVIGKPRIKAPLKIKSFETRVLEDGPLFAEVQIDYVFDVGRWSFKARVAANSPMIQIEETINTGHSEKWSKPFDRFFEFVLNTEGFKPTQGWYSDNGRMPPHTDLAKSVVPKPIADAGVSSAYWSGVGVNGYTLSFAEDREDYYLTGWATGQIGMGIMCRYVQPGGEAVAISTLHVDRWARPQSIRITTNKKGELAAQFPVQKYVQDWVVDGFHETSPNYTGVTRTTPPNEFRRSYGFMLSAAEDETTNHMLSLLEAAAGVAGHTLDKTRRLTLDWPDPKAKETWAEKTSEDADKALDRMRKRVAVILQCGDVVYWDMGDHFQYNRSTYPVLRKVIDDPNQLTAEARKELRHLCAFDAYRQSSDYQLPFGYGFHLTNPNKSIMAIEGRMYTATLIADHPAFMTWGRRAFHLLQDYMRRYTFDSGAPYENQHYTLGVTLNWAMNANKLMMEFGVGDALDSELMRSCMRYLINTWLTPPDLRFNGARSVVPLGNTSYQSVPTEFAEGFVNYYKQRDPTLAGQLQWFYNQSVAEKYKINIVEDIQPELYSQWAKDYGVIFRHGAHTPYETNMHLLAGKCFGHYELETDQMSYTLYAKGHPINMHFGNGYFPMYNRPWLRNRISFDMKIEAPERNRIEVEEANFSPAAEYFRAVRETNQLLPREAEYPLLDKKGRWTKEESENHVKWVAAWDKPEVKVPLTVWYRQMMFLKDQDPKGPNYFVLRDTFDGRPTVPTDLNFWFLANEMTRDGDVFHFDGQVKVDMDVFVHTPQKAKPHTAKYGHVAQPYGQKTGFDPAYFPDGKRREDQLLLRFRQPAGKGYLIVLYPRLKTNDPPASYQRIGESAVLVTTTLSEDLIILDAVPVSVSHNGVNLSSMAASVRKFKDGKIVLTNREGACTAGLAGWTVSGSGPFEVTIKDGKASVTWQRDNDQAVEVKKGS